MPIVTQKFARAWLIPCLVALACCLPADVSWSQSPEPANGASSPLPQAGNQINWGTGFMVGPGYVLTALHVVQGRSSVLVGPITATRWVSAALVQSDPALDLALLKARLDFPVLSLAPSNDVPRGLEVSVIGYPQPKFQGLSKKITHGIINGYRGESQNDRDIGLLQISAEVAKGSSGGPVLAPDGTVIGMVQRKINAQKIAEQTQDLLVNVNYALRSSQIIAFLQSGPVAPKVQPLSLATVLRPYQLFEQTQASVVAVIGRNTASRPAAPMSPEP